MIPSDISTVAPARWHIPAGEADLGAVVEPGWHKGRSRHCDAARVAKHWSRTDAGAPERAECCRVCARRNTKADRADHDLK